MSKKVIKIGTEARMELIKGADFLADAVKSTLGPFGLNFFLEKGNRVTNDGATVAREIEVEDEIQQRGVVGLREATLKTNDEVGDATTTATLLAQAILKEASKYLPDEKSIIGKKTPSELLRMIDSEYKYVEALLKEMATPITTEEELIKSAIVSVEDENLGRIIGSAQWELGPDGILIAEETLDPECSVEMVQGIRIDNGLGSSISINNQEKGALEVSDVKIILTSHTIQTLEPLHEIMSTLHKNGARSLVIVARAFTTEAIMECMAHVQKGYPIYPINAPYTDMNEVMKDLAAVLGGRFINVEESPLDSIQLSDVGYAKKVLGKRYSSILAGHNDDPSIKQRVEERVGELQEALKGTLSVFERRNLEARVAQLTTGIGIVKVGASSDMARKRLQDKAEDCVNAVRHAYKTGTVPGAGLAYKAASDELDEGSILKRPLYAVYEQIMSTAPEGFVIEDWVRDPLKVVVVALEKACSVAGNFATAHGASAPKNEEAKYVKEVKK